MAGLGGPGLDRAVDRTFGYDFRDQLSGSTSTFPEGTYGLLPENSASGRLAEAESYHYDALGNRLTSTTPKLLWRRIGGWPLRLPERAMQTRMSLLT